MFLNTQYYPPREELIRLEALQDVLYFSLVELAYSYRKLHPIDFIIAKQKYHSGFRSRWRVINGSKENSLPLKKVVV